MGKNIIIIRIVHKIKHKIHFSTDSHYIYPSCTYLRCPNGNKTRILLEAYVQQRDPPTRGRMIDTEGY